MSSHPMEQKDETGRIMHHADDATLVSFAGGGLPEPLAAVVAAHVAVCPVCAKTVRKMELIGSALFAGLRPEPIDGEAPVLAMRRGEAGPSPRASAVGQGGRKTVLEAVIGCKIEDVKWRRLGVGIWHAKLPRSEGSQGDLRLLKVAPGRKLPEHGHGGAELTLILSGAYTDEVGTFRSGDIADLDEDIEHRPVADQLEGCICLIASEHPAKFKSLMPRLAQPFTGF